MKLLVDLWCMGSGVFMAIACLALGLKMLADLFAPRRAIPQPAQSEPVLRLVWHMERDGKAVTR